VAVLTAASNSAMTATKPFEDIARHCAGILRQVFPAWLLLGAWLVRADETKTFSEYQVKAVFLFNFTKFAYWPPEAASQTNAPFVIGIVGKDPFGAILDQAVRTEQFHHRPIVIHRFEENETAANCQILFIARSEKDRLPSILEEVKGRPVLTVADTPLAAEQGVMINLALAQGSIKMEINQKAVVAAGLQVSGKVLSLAKIVGGEKESHQP
jgi:hypothetical protein